MPATVIVGAQWGDEGKGKIVDLLARDSDLVCRYQGGPNAGHTIVVGEETYRIRQKLSAKRFVRAGAERSPFEDLAAIVGFEDIVLRL